jgi:hypothetical protein
MGTELRCMAQESLSRWGGGQYRGKVNHPRCNCMRPAKTIRLKNKYSLCVVVEVYARKDESPPPHVKTSTGFNMGVVALTWGRWLYHGVGGFNKG